MKRALVLVALLLAGCSTAAAGKSSRSSPPRPSRSRSPPWSRPSNAPTPASTSA
ncbi:hypothetical protein ACFQV2_02690 [Actinokineospora soli]|uniref:Uncharacterized protein n=1 Tax=Actinokineospora soli TaxID=1048753 RepID=A0ABW2TH13_9PSEU